METILNVPLQNGARNYVLILSLIHLTVSISTSIFSYLKPLNYGRYANTKSILIDSRIGWFLVETPSFVIPLAMIYLNNKPLSILSPKIIMLLPFLVHYFHRAFIYPFYLTNSKSMTVETTISGIIFTTFNAYVQSVCILTLSIDTWMGLSYLELARMISGLIIFRIGLFININADRYLTGLRNQRSEAGRYFIPRGGLFEYISCPNYVGESVEWVGYAIACWTPGAISFAFGSAYLLLSRGLHHHQYYQKKFDDYPKNRKAIIPYIL